MCLVLLGSRPTLRVEGDRHGSGDGRRTAAEVRVAHFGSGGKPGSGVAKLGRESFEFGDADGNVGEVGVDRVDDVFAGGGAMERSGSGTSPARSEKRTVEVFTRCWDGRGAVVYVGLTPTSSKPERSPAARQSSRSWWNALIPGVYAPRNALPDSGWPSLL